MLFRSWHGVTHQYARQKNPYNGLSGDDFEFWNSTRNSPLFEDSQAWLLNRLSDGLDTILKSGLPAPLLWLTPHYQASALDYFIFARIFPWNAGRVIYFDYRAEGLAPAPEEKDLWLTDLDPTKMRLRFEYFKQAKVVLRNTYWIGQFFPYEIYGDLYGQRVVDRKSTRLNSSH